MRYFTLIILKHKWCGPQNYDVPSMCHAQNLGKLSKTLVGGKSFTPLLNGSASG